MDGKNVNDILIIDCSCGNDINSSTLTFEKESKMNESDSKMPTTIVDDKPCKSEKINEKSVDETNQFNVTPVQNETSDNNDLYSDEFSWSCLNLWENHWIQFASIFPAIVFMMLSGIQQLSTLATLIDASSTIYFKDSGYRSYYDYEENVEFTPKPLFSRQVAIVIVWPITAIIGNLFGGMLNRSVKKRSIYVSCRKKKLFFFTFILIFVFLVRRRYIVCTKWIIAKIQRHT